MNAAEDRLSALMDAATRALAPPIESILAEGERLGRRRRRRRRAAVAAGTAAVVLVGGVGAAAGLRLARADHDETVGAAVALQTSRAPTSAGPAPTTAPAGGPARAASPASLPTEGLEAITSQVAVKILQLSGASGWKFGSYDPRNDVAAKLLNVDVDDGKGLARISVRIGSAADSGMDPADCSSQGTWLKGGGTRPIGAPPVSCTVQPYPNGDRVMQEVLSADSYGDYLYRVIAYRVDGVAVEITATNGDPTNVKTDVTRSRPPLSLAQWTAIALDRAWQLMVPAVAAGTTPTP